MLKVVFALFCLIPSFADAELTPPLPKEDAVVKTISTTTAQDEWIAAHFRESIPLELKGIVVRDGLTLTVKNGDKILSQFKDAIDTDEGWARTVLNRFQGWSGKNNCIVVATFYYEEAAYKLINFKSGKVAKISSVPVWSPSESRFATVFSDEYGEGSSASAIWRVKDGGFVKELDYNTLPKDQDGMFLNKAEWISENEVRFSEPRKGLNCKLTGDKWSCLRFETPTAKSNK